MYTRYQRKQYNFISFSSIFYIYFYFCTLSLSLSLTSHINAQISNAQCANANASKFFPDLLVFNIEFGISAGVLARRCGFFFSILLRKLGGSGACRLGLSTVGGPSLCCLLCVGSVINTPLSDEGMLDMDEYIEPRCTMAVSRCAWRSRSARTLCCRSFSGCTRSCPCFLLDNGNGGALIFVWIVILRGMSFVFFSSFSSSCSCSSTKRSTSTSSPKKCGRVAGAAFPACPNMFVENSVNCVVRRPNLGVPNNQSSSASFNAWTVLSSSSSSEEEEEEDAPASITSKVVVVGGANCDEVMAGVEREARFIPIGFRKDGLL